MPRRGRYTLSSRSSRKSFLKKAFIGAVFAAQLAITGAFGYAAAGGDFEILGKAALVAGSSVLSGAFSAAVMGFSAAKTMGFFNKRSGTTGLAEMASSGIVIGVAMAVGYAAGAIAGPYIMLKNF